MWTARSLRYQLRFPLCCEQADIFDATPIHIYTPFTLYEYAQGDDILRVLQNVQDSSSPPLGCSGMDSSLCAAQGVSCARNARSQRLSDQLHLSDAQVCFSFRPELWGLDVGLSVLMLRILGSGFWIWGLVFRAWRNVDSMNFWQIGFSVFVLVVRMRS